MKKFIKFNPDTKIFQHIVNPFTSHLAKCRTYVLHILYKTVKYFLSNIKAFDRKTCFLTKNLFSRKVFRPKNSCRNNTPVHPPSRFPHINQAFGCALGTKWTARLRGKQLFQRIWVCATHHQEHQHEDAHEGVRDVWERGWSGHRGKKGLVADHGG